MNNPSDLLLKGVLLYLTIFIVIITVFSLEPIINEGHYIIFLIDMLLICLCSDLLTKEDLEILLFFKYFKDE